MSLVPENNKDQNVIHPIFGRLADLERIEISTETDLDVIQAGTKVVLTINDAPVAVLEVLSGGMISSPNDQHHYKIRPYELTESQLHGGSDIFHSKGEISFKSDDSHSIGGYFASGTEIDFGDRILRLPKELLDDGTLPFNESQYREAAGIKSSELGTPIVCASNHREQPPVHLTHQLGEIVALIGIGGRKTNQDAYAVAVTPDQSKLSLCVLDGNHSDGDLASRKVAELITENGNSNQSVADILLKASGELQKQYPINQKKMGTTVSAATLWTDENGESFLELTNVGDSKFILLRANVQGEFETVVATNPHNVYHEMRRAGFSSNDIIELVDIVISSGDASSILATRDKLGDIERETPLDLTKFCLSVLQIESKMKSNGDSPNAEKIASVLKNILTRALSNDPSIEDPIDVFPTEKLHAGDIVIGFSDGLEGREKEIIKLVNELRDPEEILIAVKELCDLKQPSDNYTFLLFRKN